MINDLFTSFLLNQEGISAPLFGLFSVMWLWIKMSVAVLIPTIGISARRRFEW